MTVTARQPEERNEMLRNMLVRLRDETYGRVKELRGDQEQESEPPPADDLDLARATCDIETHASLIVERVSYIL